MLFHLAKLVLVFIAATVLHWAFSSFFALWGLSVNLLLVFVIAISAFCRPQIGYPAAFFCGLFLDFFSTKLFGYNAFSFTVAAWIVYGISARLDFESLFPQLITTFTLMLLVSILNNALVLLFTAGTIWAGWPNVLAGALLGMLVSPLIFSLVLWLFGNNTLSESRY